LLPLPLVSSSDELVHHFCIQMKRFYYVRMIHLVLLRTCDQHLVFVLVSLYPVHNPFILPSSTTTTAAAASAITTTTTTQQQQQQQQQQSEHVHERRNSFTERQSSRTEGRKRQARL
jgi:hypothetical protein